MNPIQPALDTLSAAVADITGRLGHRVDIADLGVTDRAGMLALDPPDRISCNRACRLVRCRNGWIAANLAREEDQELIPAWLHGAGDDWAAVERYAARRSTRRLVEDAILLGLPVARVGEAPSRGFFAPYAQMGEGAVPRTKRPGVLDLSALWAGPLCGAVLAEMGAEVGKVESRTRPDPTRTTMPEFFERLNGAKAQVTFDFSDPAHRAELIEGVWAADILITSARPRALGALGLEPANVFAANPGLTWVAITGHGCNGEAGQRVGFGDDTAAAGGLVRWAEDGEPRFLGDALADPVTGLAAAVAALHGWEQGGGQLIDVAMSACAAAAAEHCGYAR